MPFLFCQSKKENTRQGGVRIDFTPVSLRRWREKFSLVPYSTLSQSYDYARFFSAQSGFKPLWGVIYNDEREVGVVQLFVFELFGGAFSHIILDRGPLWFCERPHDALISSFFQTLNKEFPARVARRRRIIPEIPLSREVQEVLEKAGYQEASGYYPYQTAWVNLQQSSEKLRCAFSANWRNHLVQAERERIEIRFSSNVRDAFQLLQHASRHQKLYGYRGLELSALSELVRFCAHGDGMFFGGAYSDGDLVAGAVFLRHGCCATWQSGWVHEKGRALNANHLLLARSLSFLRDQGVSRLDLGGYNDIDARGVKVFKTGLGGEHVTLAGLYF